MEYVGIAKGKTIVLPEPLPFPDGQVVNVSVEPADHPTDRPVNNARGTPAAVREAMHRPPHVRAEDVDALDRAIREGRLDVLDHDPFDAGAGH